MPTFRYQPTTSWFKGNAHIHSTASDGGKTIDQLARMYAAEGYDFLFLTDHWVAFHANGTGSAPLLLLDGIELHGHDDTGALYHVVGLGSFQGIAREVGLVKAMEAVRAQEGLLILAHPQWTGNSFDDALRYGFDGVEIYNHVCHWLNGKGNGHAYWNTMLAQAPVTLGLAVDDAHITPGHPGWNGAWIMVQAPVCQPKRILEAIRAGRFYSTCGPAFHAIEHEGRKVSVHTSPVQFVRLAGPAHLGKRVGSFDGVTIETATFEVPEDWAYAYVEIEDAQRRRAWTNALFVKE
jgi:hypothetical protein